MGDAGDLLAALGGGDVGHQAGCLLANVGQQFSHALALGEQGDGGSGFDDNQLGLGVVGLGLFGHDGSLGLKRPAVCAMLFR